MCVIGLLVSVTASHSYGLRKGAAVSLFIHPAEENFSLVRYVINTCTF